MSDEIESIAEEAAARLEMTDDEIESIAEEAAAHRRTVERRLLGLAVRGRVGARVDAALARRGLLRTTPPTAAPRAA